MPVSSHPLIKMPADVLRVSQATVIMISSLLKDSSDSLDAVSVQMIMEIIYKILNLITVYKFARNPRLDRYSYLRSESSNRYHDFVPVKDQ